jgi:outer membrane protein assembly factor BamA
MGTAAPPSPAQKEPPKPAEQKGTTSHDSPVGTEAQMLSAYSGQTVTSVELAGRPDLDQSHFLPLIEQRAGEAFDSAKVERSAAAVKSAGNFQDVQIRVLPDADGVRVLLIIQPGLYFGIYEFPGHRQFPYSRLLQISNYPPEGPYNRRDVELAAAALVKFFQQNGYFQAKVTPAIEPDPAHGVVSVRFQTELGRRANFGDVVLTGTSPAETTRLQKMLKSVMARMHSSAIRPGKRYSFKTVQNATQYMQNSLVKRDHLSAEVKMVGVEYDPQTNRAKINFQIAEGPRVHVEVTGAHLWSWTRRKLIPLYQHVGIDEELVQEGRRNLISYFQSKGYFDANVNTGVAREGDGENVVYSVKRGSRHKVASVSIDGNKTLGDSQLLSHVTVKKAKYFSHGDFSEALLRASVKNLEATYHADGFSSAKVTPRIEGKGGNIDVTFVVEEGARDIVRELRVTGNKTMTLTALIPKGLKLRPGEPYSQTHANEDRQQISVKYLQSGYLTSTFRESIQREKDDKHGLIVTYEIYEGPKVIISSVLTLGREQTKQQLIDRAVKFKLHAPLSFGGMLSAESRLYNSGIFDWAEVRPRRQITTQDSEDVLVRVHESHRSALTYGFGFEVTNRGGSVPSGTVAVPGLPPVGVSTSFRTSQRTFWGPLGSAAYTRRNIFGEAETLTLGTIDGRLLQRVNANFQNPSFRGTSWISNLNATFEHNSENPIFTDRIEQIGFQLQKHLDHKHTQTLFARYSFSGTQITNLIIPPGPEGLIQNSSDLDVRLSTLSATYIRDTRDNNLDAKRGSYQSFETAFNPSALGSSVSFVKLLMQSAYYRKIPYSIVWANSLRLGFAPPFDGSEVPLSQLFFSGGGSTLRGFPLDGAGPQRAVLLAGPGILTPEQISVPTGGRQLAIFNSEFRIPLPFDFPILGKHLGAAAFYDGGNVFTAIGFHGQYTNTIGGGLRYSTPLGPVRFDIGHNLNAPPGVSSIQYFITLGQAF